MVDAIPTPETWRPVAEPGFEHVYEVSDLGRVRRVGKAKAARVGRIMRQYEITSGYLTVGMRSRDVHRRRTVHRLVLLAFVGPCPEGQECNHKNGDKHDNRLVNLEWMTHGDNARHAYQTGLNHPVRGERSPRAKLTADQVREIRRLKYVIPSYEIAEQFGIKQRTVWGIWSGKSWRWLQ